MPSLRRRAQAPPTPQAEAFSESEEFGEDEEMVDEEEMLADEAEEGIDGEGEEDGDEEPLASPTQLDPHNAHIPPNLREISTLASWTVSSSKPGCSIPQLRNPSTALFWQSDGPQPHYLNIHFFKLVRIVGLRLFLDFEADESYTPTRIVFLAGSGNNDLVEWGEMRLEQPHGWIWADFSGVGDADDEDGDEDDDEEEGEEGNEDSDSEPMRIPGLADALAEDHDASSDSENARPGAGTLSTPIPAHMGAGNVLMDLLDPADTPSGRPQPHNPHPQTTPSSSTPTLARRRHRPRLPFQPLHSAASPPPPSLRRSKPRMPVLRAHLVQIKILENHQNGKDTHLRGLQIFARDNEGARAPRPTASPAKAFGMKAGREAKARNGVGGGGRMPARSIGRSEWDMEPSIR